MPDRPYSELRKEIFGGGDNASPSFEGMSYADFKANHLNKPTVNETESSPFTSTVKSTSAGILNSLAGQPVEDIGKLTGSEGLQNFGKGVREYSEGVQKANPSQINSLGDIVDKPGTAIKTALGNLVPQVPLSMAGAYAGAKAGAALPLPANLKPIASAIGAGAGMFVPSYAQEYSEMRGKQNKSGQEDIGKAALAAIPAAGLETAADYIGLGRLVPNGIAGDVLQEGASRLAHVGKQALKGTVAETGTEYLQTGLEQYGGNEDLTTDQAANERNVSAALGGIGGGVMRGGISAFDQRQSNLVPPAQEQPVVQEEPKGPLSRAASQANVAPVVDEQMVNPAINPSGQAEQINPTVLQDEQQAEQPIQSATSTDNLNPPRTDDAMVSASGQPVEASRIDSTRDNQETASESAQTELTPELQRAKFRQAELTKAREARGDKRIVNIGGRDYTADSFIAGQITHGGNTFEDAKNNFETLFAQQNKQQETNDNTARPETESTGTDSRDAIPSTNETGSGLSGAESRTTDITENTQGFSQQVENQNEKEKDQENAQTDERADGDIARTTASAGNSNTQADEQGNGRGLHGELGSGAGNGTGGLRGGLSEGERDSTGELHNNTDNTIPELNQSENNNDSATNTENTTDTHRAESTIPPRVNESQPAPRQSGRKSDKQNTQSSQQVSEELTKATESYPQVKALVDGGVSHNDAIIAARELASGDDGMVKHLAKKHQIQLPKQDANDELKFTTPEYKVSHDADAIVRNRTKQGEGIQSYLDNRNKPTGITESDLRTVNAWEQPQYNEQETQQAEETPTTETPAEETGKLKVGDTVTPIDKNGYGGKVTGVREYNGKQYITTEESGKRSFAADRAKLSDAVEKSVEENQVDLSSENKGIASLRSLPIDTKEDANAYIKAFEDFRYRYGTDGGAVKPKNTKPLSVTNRDIFDKLGKAKEVAEKNYWQMPYEEAKKNYRGLPKKKWESERIKRGLPLDETEQQTTSIISDATPSREEQGSDTGTQVEVAKQYPTEKAAKQAIKRSKDKSIDTHDAVEENGKWIIKSKPEQQEPVQAESKPEEVSEQELIDYGLLRHDPRTERWKYKFHHDSSLKFANSKESAIERAREAFKNWPESERKTKAQQAEEADREREADIDKRYSSRSIEELEKLVSQLEKKKDSLYRAGQREFNGNGGRRTSAAVSSEAARDTAEEIRNIEDHIQRRKGKESEQKEEILNEADIEHNGVRIYRLKIKDTNYYAVETDENKERRLSGDRNRGGDGLLETLDAAKKEADRQIARREEAAKRKKELAEEEKKAEEAKAKKKIDDDIDGFNDDAEPKARGLAVKYLNKPIRSDGKVTTIKELVKSKLASGEKTSTVEEDKIKPMSRMAYFRSDERQQKEHEKRVKEGGKKTVYLVGDTDLGKIAYDYANYLSAKESEQKETKLDNANVDAKTEQDSVVGKGNTGEVHRIGDEVEKNSTNDEAKVYELLKGVEGVAQGYEKDGKIRLPYYKHIISVDTIARDKREGMSSIVKRNIERINNAVSALINTGYEYNDPLQFGVNDDKTMDLMDFSNADNKNPKDALQNNLIALSSFYKQFGLERVSKAVSQVNDVLTQQHQRVDDPGTHEFLGEVYDDVDYRKLEDALNGKKATNAYYTTNARHVGLKDIAQTDNINGVTVVLSTNPLSQKDIDTWELVPVYASESADQVISSESYEGRLIEVKRNTNGKSVDIFVNGGLSNFKIPQSEVNNKIKQIKRFINEFPSAHQESEDTNSGREKLNSIFKQLGRNSYKSASAELKSEIDNHPDAELIKQVQKHWSDVLLDVGFENKEDSNKPNSKVFIQC